jgi:hypothetical protein
MPPTAAAPRASGDPAAAAPTPPPGPFAELRERLAIMRQAPYWEERDAQTLSLDSTSSGGGAGAGEQENSPQADAAAQAEARARAGSGSHADVLRFLEGRDLTLLVQGASRLRAVATSGPALPLVGGGPVSAFAVVRLAPWCAGSAGWDERRTLPIHGASSPHWNATFTFSDPVGTWRRQAAEGARRAAVAAATTRPRSPAGSGGGGDHPHHHHHHHHHALVPGHPLPASRQRPEVRFEVWDATQGLFGSKSFLGQARLDLAEVAFEHRVAATGSGATGTMAARGTPLRLPLRVYARQARYGGRRRQVSGDFGSLTVWVWVGTRSSAVPRTPSILMAAAPEIRGGSAAAAADADAPSSQKRRGLRFAPSFASGGKGGDGAAAVGGGRSFKQTAAAAAAAATAAAIAQPTERTELYSLPLASASSAGPAEAAAATAAAAAAAETAAAAGSSRLAATSAAPAPRRRLLALDPAATLPSPVLPLPPAQRPVPAVHYARAGIVLEEPCAAIVRVTIVGVVGLDAVANAFGMVPRPPPPPEVGQAPATPRTLSGSSLLAHRASPSLARLGSLLAMRRVSFSAGALASPSRPAAQSGSGEGEGEGGPAASEGAIASSSSNSITGLGLRQRWRRRRSSAASAGSGADGQQQVDDDDDDLLLYDEAADAAAARPTSRGRRFRRFASALTGGRLGGGGADSEDDAAAAAEALAAAALAEARDGSATGGGASPPSALMLRRERSAAWLSRRLRAASASSVGRRGGGGAGAVALGRSRLDDEGGDDDDALDREESRALLGGGGGGGGGGGDASTRSGGVFNALRRTDYYAGYDHDYDHDDDGARPRRSAIAAAAAAALAASGSGGNGGDPSAPAAAAAAGGGAAADLPPAPLDEIENVLSAAHAADGGDDPTVALVAEPAGGSATDAATATAAAAASGPPRDEQEEDRRHKFLWSPTFRASVRDRAEDDDDDELEGAAKDKAAPAPPAKAKGGNNVPRRSTDSANTPAAAAASGPARPPPPPPPLARPPIVFCHVSYAQQSRLTRAAPVALDPDRAPWAAADPSSPSPPLGGGAYARLRDTLMFVDTAPVPPSRALVVSVFISRGPGRKVRLLGQLRLPLAELTAECASATRRGPWPPAHPPAFRDAPGLVTLVALTKRLEGPAPGVALQLHVGVADMDRRLELLGLASSDGSPPEHAHGAMHPAPTAALGALAGLGVGGSGGGSSGGGARTSLVSPLPAVGEEGASAVVGAVDAGAGAGFSVPRRSLLQTLLAPRWMLRPTAPEAAAALAEATHRGGAVAGALLRRASMPTSPGVNRRLGRGAAAATAAAAVGAAQAAVAEAERSATSSLRLAQPIYLPPRPPRPPPPPAVLTLHIHHVAFGPGAAAALPGLSGSGWFLVANAGPIWVRTVDRAAPPLSSSSSSTGDASLPPGMGPALSVRWEVSLPLYDPTSTLTLAVFAGESGRASGGVAAAAAAAAAATAQSSSSRPGSAQSGRRSSVTFSRSGDGGGELGSSTGGGGGGIIGRTFSALGVGSMAQAAPSMLRPGKKAAAAEGPVKAAPCLRARLQLSTLAAGRVHRFCARLASPADDPNAAVAGAGSGALTAPPPACAVTVSAVIDFASLRHMLACHGCPSRGASYYALGLHRGRPDVLRQQEALRQRVVTRWLHAATAASGGGGGGMEGGACVDAGGAVGAGGTSAGGGGTSSTSLFSSPFAGGASSSAAAAAANAASSSALLIGLPPPVSTAVLDFGRDSFQFRRLRANFERFQQAVKRLRAILLGYQRLLSWRSPWRTLTALAIVAGLALATSRTVAVLMLWTAGASLLRLRRKLRDERRARRRRNAARMLALADSAQRQKAQQQQASGTRPGSSASPSRAATMEPNEYGDDDLAATAALGEGGEAAGGAGAGAGGANGRRGAGGGAAAGPGATEEFDTSSAAGLAALRARLERVTRVALVVQNRLDDLARHSERVTALAEWRDPVASGVLTAALAVLAVIVGRVGLAPVVVVVVVWVMRPPFLRRAVPGFGGTVWRRLPDNSASLDAGGFEPLDVTG